MLISVNQQSLQSSLGTLLHAPFIEQGHRSFWQHLTPALVLALTIGGLTAGLVFPLAWRLSAVTLRDRYVRGAQIVTPLQLAQRMRQPKSDPRPLRSPLLLGGHDVLHPHFERQHVRIEGTTGSGKSVLIREFLSWIRAQGDRAIIYDKGCSFVGQFYQPDTDTLLNPFDARSVNWDLWCDATHAADFDHQASALIPVPPQWRSFLERVGSQCICLRGSQAEYPRLSSNHRALAEPAHQLGFVDAVYVACWYRSGHVCL
ncbi:type IV secretion system DNA-binding domain-containing protein [Vibrio coralliilyticus]|uniref:type IV secretion system DNA-binding domain-containing protein n=1 Tax=Vibrio coralliilyticus TaxID=190893 RepID=UPI001300C707|nr:type IV secretion system DNA-binding domain-containing protein [Vibrio coralliilyticus]